jgi:ABC-type Fe3+ transport system permease subunit
MFGYRWLRAAAPGVLWLLTVAPVIALALAVVADRGPAGQVRITLFPLALLALDPFVWTCVRNSVIFAVVVSGISLVVGVGLAWVMARRRFWGRAVLRGAVGGLLAASPIFLALGLEEPRNSGFWSISVRGAASEGLSLESWGGLALWALWAWATLPGAVAGVTLATAAAIERLEPAWSDAARMAGDVPSRAWWNLSWPLVRPAAARALAIAFPLALVEPGAPLILGLRRTLAFQIVEAATHRDSFPRVAVWAALAGLIGLGGWIVIRWWGGHPVLDDDDGLEAPAARPALPAAQRAPALQALACTLVLACWAILGWLPLVGLLRLALATGWEEVGLLRALPELSERIVDPPARQFAINSLLLGLEVAAIVVVLGWLVQRDPRRRPREPAGALPARSIFFVPPLVQGVGILSIPWLIELGVNRLSGLPGWDRISVSLHDLSAVLAPDRNSWIILVCSVVIIVGVPMLNCWRRSSELDDLGRRSQFEGALLAGASRARARILATPWRWRRWLGRFLLVWGLGATNLAPALLLTPWADGRTIAPGVLVLADAPDDARPQAAALALCAVGINITALVAGRAASTGSRPFPPGPL